VTWNGPTAEEGQLLYPDTEVIRRSDESGFRVLARVDATPEEILAWYQDELERLGFLDGAGAASARTSVESYACAWHREGTAVRLSFLDRRVVLPELFDGESSTVYRWYGWATEREFRILPRCVFEPPPAP
jgi:hypothetical protein